MAKWKKESKWLTSEDISDVEDTIVTIKSYDKQLMGQGDNANERWVVYFRELKKGLGLNTTNANTIISLIGSDDMDDWIGRKIALYVKPDVEYQGKTGPAIRIRAKAPGGTKANANSADMMQKLELCQTRKEVMGCMKEIAIGNYSEDDKEALTVFADQRMEVVSA